MKRLAPIFIFLLSSLVVSGQDTISQNPDTLSENTYLLKNVMRDGETLPEVEIKEVKIISNSSMGSRFEYWKYRRLIDNLKRVYPYALIVRQRIEKVNNDLANLSTDKEKRQYINEVEKDVFASYEGDMREMTVTQGKLLIKLIDRETSSTSFELLQDYKGKFSASFWQSIARIFGTNLKDEYDPYGDDALIEFLIEEIDSGRI